METSTKRTNKLWIVLAVAFTGVGFLTIAGRPTVSAPQSHPDASFYNVRTLGVKGDGKTLDTAAINQAIEAAAAAGGGTVYFPAGNYLSVSIHLKSNIALYLDQDATIIGANTSNDVKYDPPEPNEWTSTRILDTVIGTTA